MPTSIGHCSRFHVLWTYCPCLWCVSLLLAIALLDDFLGYAFFAPLILQGFKYDPVQTQRKSSTASRRRADGDSLQFIQFHRGQQHLGFLCFWPISPISSDVASSL